MPDLSGLISAFLVVNIVETIAEGVAFVAIALACLWFARQIA